MLEAGPEIARIGMGCDNHAFGVQHAARRFHCPAAGFLPDGAHRAIGMHHRTGTHHRRRQAARIAERIDPPAGLILPPAMPVIRAGQGGHLSTVHHPHRGAAAAPLFHAGSRQFHA